MILETRETTGVASLAWDVMFFSASMHRYPVISTCPLDEQYTRLEKENELAKALQAETEKERARLLGAVGAGESDSKGEETKTVDVAGVDENDDNVRTRHSLCAAGCRGVRVFDAV